MLKDHACAVTAFVHADPIADFAATGSTTVTAASCTNIKSNTTTATSATSTTSDNCLVVIAVAAATAVYHSAVRWEGSRAAAVRRKLEDERIAHWFAADALPGRPETAAAEQRGAEGLPELQRHNAGRIGERGRRRVLKVQWDRSSS